MLSFNFRLSFENCHFEILMTVDLHLEDVTVEINDVNRILGKDFYYDVDLEGFYYLLLKFKAKSN